MPRRYSNAEKRRILDHLMLNGGDVVLTAQQYGASPATVYRWLRDENFRIKADSHSYHSYHSASPRPLDEEPGGEGFSPHPDDPLMPFIPAMVAKASDLLASIDEAIQDAPLNQRVAALVQLIDRIERMRFRRALYPLHPPAEDVQIVYEYEVEGHVEKEDDLDEIPFDQTQDQTPNTSPEPADRAQE